jgi:hypothetical protein
MLFARRVFLAAGVYGLAVLVPQYFLEGKTGRDHPPAITHPEFYYGFVGVALAWQAAFLIIARDPVRYRLMMLPSMLEKLTFGAAAVALFAAGRLATVMLLAGLADLAWLALFIAAYRSTADTTRQA